MNSWSVAGGVWGAYYLGDPGAYGLILQAVNKAALTNLSILNPASKWHAKNGPAGRLFSGIPSLQESRGDDNSFKY